MEVNTTVFKHPKYDLVRKIADGAEGVVWEVVNNVTGSHLALKFYKSKDKWEHEKMIIKEIRTRCTSNQLIIDKFISIEGSEIYGSFQFTVFEKCRRTLEQHFKEEVAEERVGMELLVITKMDILPAFVFLESIGICHGDIKASNILLWKKLWVIADFDCAGFVDDDAVGGTHAPPEFRRRIAQGKNPILSHRGDVFSLGVMLIDILAGFTFWLSIENDSDYENYEVPFEIPDNVDSDLKPKLSALIVKDPLFRITFFAFSKSSIFKSMSTKKIEEMGNQVIKQALGNIESQVSKVDSHVKQGIDQKLTKLHRNLNEFLPAIQENLMQVLSVTGVPNRFVLIPEKASFMDSFFKKYRLYFLCDCGFHMVKSDDIGYSMIQITELGKGIMIVAKILISIAIKQLIGLSDPGIIQGIESAIGLADKGMQMLPDIMQTDSLNDIKDLKINMKMSDELVGYDIKNEDDWVRIFAPIKPILKSFLESKSPEKMGVQIARDQYGKSAWLCKVHAKEMFDMKPISNSIN